MLVFRLLTEHAHTSCRVPVVENVLGTCLSRTSVLYTTSHLPEEDSMTADTDGHRN